MTDQPPLFHPTAAEGAAAERSELLRLLDDHEVALDAVDAAIARNEAGEYGWCVRCGERLADDRLDGDPTATACDDPGCGAPAVTALVGTTPVDAAPPAAPPPAAPPPAAPPVTGP